MKKVFLFILLLCSKLVLAQSSNQLVFDKLYNDIKFEGKDSIEYTVKLRKKGLYQFSVMQNGVDVVISLHQQKKKLVEMDSPNGKRGLERFEFASKDAGEYIFRIKSFESNKIDNKASISIKIKSFTDSDIARFERNKRELAPENRKTVMTADIDHFWEAYDALKKCKTYDDSVDVVQKIYFDRATDGLKEFIRVRPMTAERLVKTIASYPKFYGSIKNNTLEVKKASVLIEEVFKNFSELYPNFKKSKVCFVIGVIGTGGTVTDGYVLIGAEISTSTHTVDLSELKSSSMYPTLSGNEDIVQKIKNIVAHECVHIQQPTDIDKNAIECDLLFKVLNEGSADFIGNLISKGNINASMQAYGDAHEKELWEELKAELCNTNSDNWLYNYDQVKDKPADLGYYVGYKIAESYYKNATDKQQAIIDIIEMRDPLKFLINSFYK